MLKIGNPKCGVVKLDRHECEAVMQAMSHYFMDMGGMNSDKPMYEEMVEIAKKITEAFLIDPCWVDMKSV